MPLGVSPGMNARLWWRGLTPKNRSQAGAPSAGRTDQLRRQAHRVAQREAQHIAVEVQRLRVVAGGQHYVTESLFLGDELVAVWADDPTVLQRHPVEDFERIARRVVEHDHPVDAPVSQFGRRRLLVGGALQFEPVADVLQVSGIRCLPTGLQQPVMLTRHDHQPGRELVHPQIQRTVWARPGHPGPFDQSEHLECVFAPRRHVGGFEAQVAQRPYAHDCAPLDPPRKSTVSLLNSSNFSN